MLGFHDAHHVPRGADGRLSMGASVLVIALLSAASWGVLINLVIAARTLF